MSEVQCKDCAHAQLDEAEDSEKTCWCFEFGQIRSMTLTRRCESFQQAESEGGNAK